MNWSEHLFQYCERGLTVSFWAEPLNAVSNAAFILVGLMTVRLLAAHKSARLPIFQTALTVILFSIGIGSFLFHTFANRWSELADVIPISIFVVCYFAFALRHFLGIRWPFATTAAILFAVVSQFAGSIKCAIPAPYLSPGRIGDTTCLWGSVAYGPALLGLWGIGWLLHRQSHPAAFSLLSAAAIFSASVIVRTIDIPLCGLTAMRGGGAIGTHFMWHIFNACTLYLLLRASIIYSAPQAKQKAG